MHTLATFHGVFSLSGSSAAHLSPWNSRRFGLYPQVDERIHEINYMPKPLHTF
jgi:hypothetical protein